jgi:hypothetical protein
VCKIRQQLLLNEGCAFFLPFFLKYLLYLHKAQESFMPKATAKEQVKSKAKPKKLSKCGEWMLKHPNGGGLIIHDMKAVLREYDTPWWYTPEKKI